MKQREEEEINACRIIGSINFQYIENRSVLDHYGFAARYNMIDGIMCFGKIDF